MPEAFFLVCGGRVDFDLEKEVAGVGYAEVFDYAVAEMVRNVSHAALKEGGVELAVCQRHRGIAADQIVKLFQSNHRRSLLNISWPCGCRGS